MTRILAPASAIAGAIVLPYALSYAVGALPQDVAGGMLCCTSLLGATIGYTVGLHAGRNIERNYELTRPREIKEPAKVPVKIWRETLRLDYRPAPGHRKYYYLPPSIDNPDLKRVALAVVDGAAFSYPGLVVTGILTRAQFRDLQAWAVKMHWARWNNPDRPRAGAPLTRAGVAAMEYLAHSPTLPAGMLERK